MYLKPDDVDQLLDEMSNLSAKDSCVIINFSVSSPASHPDKLDERMEQNGWTTKTRVFFGEEVLQLWSIPKGQACQYPAWILYLHKLSKLWQMSTALDALLMDPFLP